MLGVCLTTFLIGVSLAWLVCRYNFYMKNIIEWALLLPLALPSYIVAYCYTDFFEYSGVVQTILRDLFNFSSPSDYYFPEIRSLGGAVFVISFVLYPYVYLITKVAFKSTPSSLIEFAEISGKNIFYFVSLPLAKPAIVAGLSLVLMETVSDFGTVDFFAVETITLGIFNLWLGMNNLASASQLALVGFTFVVVLLALELYARKRQKFNDPKFNTHNFFNVQVSKSKNIIIFSICIMPILFGFLIPVLILIENSLNYFHLENFNYLVTVAQNSFFISFTTATIIILLSIILTVSIKYQNFKGFNFLSTIAGIGYAFPGIIIALGTLFFVSFIEKFISLSLESFSIDLNLILIGSYFLLIFAYVSRFNAVSFGAINSGISRLPPNLLEASRSLGNPFWYSFRKVILPLLRPSILTAFILAFVDIIKELPITLLLRPFNFETLATYVYQYANDEMLERASSAALLIVIIGLLPILFINKIMNINKKII
jgi:iron(III) transport system permease protein